jgi:hypothetical protein
MAIQRTAPTLLGVFCVVRLMAHQYMTKSSAPEAARQTAWYDKRHPTFSDALALVRKELWAQEMSFCRSAQEVESRLQAFLKVLLAHPRDRRLAHLHGLCDRIVHPAWSISTLVGFEQDASVSELAGAGSASSDQVLEIVSFGFVEDIRILFLHNGHKHTP